MKSIKSIRRKNMFEKVVKVLCEYTSADPASITEKTNLTGDLALDSLQLINLAGAIEDEFDITVSDRDAMEIQTVGDVVRLIEERS